MKVTKEEIDQIISLGEDSLIDIIGDYDAVPTHYEYNLIDKYFSENHPEIYAKILDYRKDKPYLIGIETELSEILPINTPDGYDQYIKYCEDIFNITTRLQNAFHLALQDVEDNYDE